MNKITEREQLIINYLNTGEKSKQQIVNKFNDWFAKDSYKHISTILKTMYYSGIIQEVSRDNFILCELEEEDCLQEEKKSETIQGSLF